MSIQYDVLIGGKVYGPFDVQKVRQLIAQGKLDKDSDVRIGDEIWTKARKIKHFFDMNGNPVPFEPTPPPIPPPTHEASIEPILSVNSRTEGRHQEAISGIPLQAKATIIACIIGSAGVFLPWIKAPIVGGLNGSAFLSGYVVLLVFFFVAVHSLKGIGNRNKPIGFETTHLFLSLIPICVASFQVYRYGISGIFGKVVDDGLSILNDEPLPGGPGFGLFLVLVSGLSVLLIPIYVKK